MATMPLSTSSSASFRLKSTLSTEQDLGWKDFLVFPPRTRHSCSVHESSNRFFLSEQYADTHRSRVAASSGIPMWKARLLCPSSLTRCQSPPRSPGPTSPGSPGCNNGSLIYPWFPAAEASAHSCTPSLGSLAKTLSSPAGSSSVACCAMTGEAPAEASSFSKEAQELKGGTVLVASLGTKVHPLADSLVRHFDERCSGLPHFQHLSLIEPPKAGRFTASRPQQSVETMQEKVPADCHSLFTILTAADASAKDRALALREAVDNCPGLSTTVALVILPMAFKGTRAYRQAHEVTEALRGHYGTVVVVDQGELLGRDELDLTLSAAAELAEETAGRAAEALLHLLRTHDQRLGRISPREGQRAPVLCVGYGEGPSVREATEQALDSPFLQSACQSNLQKAAAVCMLSDRTAPDLDDIVTRGEAKVVQSLLLKRLSLSQGRVGGSSTRAVELLVAPAVDVVDGTPKDRLATLSSAFSSTVLLFSSDEAALDHLRQVAVDQVMLGDGEEAWTGEETENGDAALRERPWEEREGFLQSIGASAGTEPTVSLREVVSLVQGRMAPEDVDTWLRRPGTDDKMARRAVTLLLENRGEGQASQSSGDFVSQLRLRGSAGDGPLSDGSGWSDYSEAAGPSQADNQGAWTTWVPGKRRVSLDGREGPGISGWNPVMRDSAPPEERNGASLEGQPSSGWWGNVRRTLGRAGSSAAGAASPDEGSAALRQRVQRVLDLERPAVSAGSPERIQKKLSLVETAYQGGIYHGTAHKGVPQGMGALSFANGAFYRGGWVDGKRHGKGRCRSSSGTEYVGGWQDDKRHGQGVVQFPNGDKFQGTWKEGQVLGWGTHTFSNGDAYSGWFRQNARDGPGLLVSNANEIWFEVWDLGELLLKWRCRQDDL